MVMNLSLIHIYILGQINDLMYTYLLLFLLLGTGLYFSIRSRFAQVRLCLLYTSVCEDEAAFTHTDGLEAEYILESGENDGVNWFLDEYGEKKKLEATQGFLSVYDEIGTILDTEKGNEILNGLFISFGEGGKALLTESVQNSIRSLTFVELAKMIGPATVSYTHLDVYKRQREVCLFRGRKEERAVT